MAHLTKDVLASGSGCPMSFVDVLKNQLCRLRQNMDELTEAQGKKEEYGEEFVEGVWKNWNKRYAGLQLEVGNDY